MPRSSAEQDFQDVYQFQRRDWLAQRIGWGAMALFVIAAVAGAFGEGPLSARTVGETRLATMELQRFARHAAPTTFTLRAGPGSIVGGELTITVERSFFEAYRIESITPEPLRADAARGLLTFAFAASAPEAVIAFHVEPQKIGWHSGAFLVGGRAQLRIEQFVYP